MRIKQLCRNLVISPAPPGTYLRQQGFSWLMVARNIGTAAMDAALKRVRMNYWLLTARVQKNTFPNERD
jgi:hypothetical protein